MSIGNVGESTREVDLVSTQQTATQTSTQQTIQTSTQQTLQVSAELEIGKSTNRVQGPNQSSIQKTSEMSAQQNTQSSAEQIVKESVTRAVVQEPTSTQQTTRTSVTDLDIPSYSDQVTLARSSRQYGSGTSELVEDVLVRQGERIRESATENGVQSSESRVQVDLSTTQQITQTSELARENSIKREIFDQSSTQQTANVSTDLTTETSAVHEMAKESSVQYGEQDDVTILQENHEKITAESLTSETVTDSTQEHGRSSVLQTIQTSLQTAVENTIGSYGGKVVEVMNVAIQPRETVAPQFFGAVESVQDGIISSTQSLTHSSSALEFEKSTTLVSVSESSVQDAGQVPDVLTVHPGREFVQDTVVDEIVKDSTKNSSELSTQVTSQTSALEIGKSTATVTKATGQYDDRSVNDAITLLDRHSVRETAKGEIMQDSTQQLGGSSTQQATWTSTQCALQTPETAQTSAGQTVRASAELRIQESTDDVEELTKSLTKDTTHTLAQQTSQISTLTDRFGQQFKSTNGIGQSPIMLTTQVKRLKNDAFVILGRTTIENNVRGSMSVLRESEGETDSSSVDGKTVTATIQGTTALSFEHVQASTESAAYMQSSTRENSTALKTTTQVAVTDSEQHRREQLVDSLSSSTQNTSNIAIKSVEDVMVGAITNKNKKVHAPSTATEYNILSCEFSGFRVRK